MRRRQGDGRPWEDFQERKKREEDQERNKQDYLEWKQQEKCLERKEQIERKIAKLREEIAELRRK